ncbi:CMP-N-acetylneuraminate-poly-alpha-2,8-sialyltransferase-like isoform X2 [Branchiostoma floridae]|uniref:CMP-N-acetylneuraminate-poly-alpha-2, 8-sialyltransferase-like isoform X2 n=1 Tax=Branchiostoma floridae TaxID=7739 RepID=A0A9J7KMC5_BRAFL|nr:CMP-N-acetylneuraminate-poly-alpha-2,8-sialyltransferase-like isoform X2 [Branchiostoma floridae]
MRSVKVGNDMKRKAVMRRLLLLTTFMLVTLVLILQPHLQQHGLLYKTASVTSSPPPSKSELQGNFSAVAIPTGHALVQHELKRHDPVNPDERHRTLLLSKTVLKPPSNRTNLTQTEVAGPLRTRFQERIVDAKQWSWNRTAMLEMRNAVRKVIDTAKSISILRSQTHIGDVMHYDIDNHNTFNITKDLYDLLPETSPLEGRLFNSCAIVGNSGILLGSGCGQEIDSHDFVIRCNLAPVTEYVKDVGRKSDLVTMNPSVLPTAFGGLKEKHWEEKFVKRLRMLEHSMLWIPAFTTINGEKYVQYTNRIILKNDLNIKTLYPTKHLAHSIRGFWLQAKTRIKRPSTGLYMYTIATRFCQEIHLYGFFPFTVDVNGRPVRYHYYDNGKYNFYDKRRPHSMPVEFQALRRLHDKGALRLLTDKCT